jgi:DNA-binding NarL/FixJ family response regulator
VVAELWPTEKLVACAVESEPAVLVLDGWLSGADLRTVARGIEVEPSIAVLVVGPLWPNIEVLVALASGITGYLPTDSKPEAIADTVGALYAGEVVVPRGIALPLVADGHLGGRGITVDRADGRVVELTHREWAVFVLVRQAYSTAEIARHLVVAGVTVRTHIAAVVRKLGVPDRTFLAQPPTCRGR